MRTVKTVPEILDYIRSLDDGALLRFIARYRLMIIHEMDDHLGLPHNIVMNNIDINRVNAKTIQDLDKLVNGKN